MKKIFPQGPLAIHHVPENSKLLKFASFISQDYKYGIVLNLYMGKGMCLEHCKCPIMIYLPAVTAGFEMFTRCTLFLKIKLFCIISSLSACQSDKPDHEEKIWLSAMFCLQRRGKPFQSQKPVSISFLPVCSLKLSINFFWSSDNINYEGKYVVKID